MNVGLYKRLFRSLLGQGARLAALSVASFILGFSVTTLSVEVFGLPARTAYPLALVVCTTVNFFGCRHWVFRTAHMPFWPETIRFFTSILAFRLVEIVMFNILLKISDDYRIAYVVTQSVSTILKFIVAKIFVFKAQMPS